VKNRLVLLAIAAVSIGALSLSACSSSDSSSNSTTSTTASSGPQVTDPDCSAFTGTVGTSSGGTASVTSTLSSITTNKEGCVDNIQLEMTGGVGSWTVAYATAPVTDSTGATVAVQGAATLVVTLKGGTWSGTPAAPTTVLPVQLDYVESIDVVTGSDGALLVVMGLSDQKPYVASDSAETPGYISLGIG